MDRNAESDKLKTFFLQNIKVKTSDYVSERMKGQIKLQTFVLYVTSVVESDKT
jgi:hypothetical protein